MIGSPRLHERVTSSTNERARALALAGAPHGTLVTADEQTAGRGRQGRSWLAEPGEAVLMSLVVRELQDASLLPLAAAVAACEACERFGVTESLVKWPNDVWIDGRKVAGILIEGRPQEGWAVLGIGFNVSARSFPAELDAIATSLALAGADASVPDVLRALLETLDRWLAAKAGDVLAAWRARDALRGHEVSWNDGRGVAAGISDDGALLVELHGGETTALHAGEVHLRRS